MVKAPMRRWIRWPVMTLIMAVVVVALARAGVAAELVMFESAACPWCAAWHAEIGPIYPKTAEGKAAPLRTVDIDDPRPPDLERITGIRFTPTFVLLDDDNGEVGRINGYPGEAFFWGMLGALINKLPETGSRPVTPAS